MKERIYHLISALGVSDKNFSLRVGKSESFARNIKKSIGSDVVGNILQEFPEIDAYWLLTGEGDMFKINNTNSVGNNNNITGSNTGNMSGGQIVGGNNINVSLPAAGTQKIIKSDGSVEIVSITSEDPHNATAKIESLNNKIQDMQTLIESLNQTIAIQKDFIDSLRNK